MRRVLEVGSQIIGIGTALFFAWSLVTGYVEQLLDSFIVPHVSGLLTERTRFGDWTEVTTPQDPREALTDGFLLVLEPAGPLFDSDHTYWVDTGDSVNNLQMRSPVRPFGLTAVPIRKGEYYRVRYEARGVPAFLREPRVYWLPIGTQSGGGTHAGQ